MNRVLAGFLATILLGAFMSPVALGQTAPQTWNIYYTSNSCYPSGTTWTPSAVDGGGFGTTNLNSGSGSPIVSAGDTLYIYVTVSGATASTSYYYEIDGGNSPYPGPVLLLTTDSSGSGSGCISVSITSAMASTLNSACTVPEKISEGSTSNFDGHIIDHLLGSGYPTCGGTSTTTTSTTTFPPPPVPEFPIGGMVAVLAILVPALAFLKLRRQGIRSS